VLEKLLADLGHLGKTRRLLVVGEIALDVAQEGTGIRGFAQTILMATLGFTIRNARGFEAERRGARERGAVGVPGDRCRGGWRGRRGVVAGSDGGCQSERC
jgi:hypothetical protein